MKQQAYILSETRYIKYQSHPVEIAIIPWGATEAHNYHLPYATDNYLTQAFADESAKKAFQMGIPLSVLPLIPFGVNTGQLDLPLTINMNPSTQKILLEDIINSLIPHHIHKIVIFNGHGGNDFKQIIREFQGKYPGLFICQVNWYQSIPANKYFEDTGEHAGEMETSLMMYLFPDLVGPLTEAGSGDHREMVYCARKEGWMWAPRQWTSVTKDTGIGNPSKSTIAKGKQFFEKATDKIAQFFKELYIEKEIYK